MNGYPTDTYGQAQGVSADGTAAWYGDQSDPSGGQAAPEQQGFSIPTTGQANGGGPMRRGGGGARFNPMGRGGGRPPMDTTPATATGAEKNELGYIVFAYNIGYQTDEAQIHGLFTPFGTVAKINVIQDFNTGMNKGYAFVTMPNQAEAEAAVNGLNGSSFNGNTLQVRFKSPKGQGPPPNVMMSRGGRGGMRGGRGGMRGAPRGAPRGMSSGFRGARGAGMPRGGAQRGRGRGAYSATPSAYDYGYAAAPAAAPTAYDQYGYPTDPNAYAAYADYSQAAGAGGDPYAAYAAPAAAAAGTGYTSYGAAPTGW